MSAIRDIVVVEAAGRDAEETAALQALVDLVSKVDREKPDPGALAQLRGILDSTPPLARVLCDLVELNSQKVIKTIVTGAAASEALSRQCRAMRDGMGYQEAPELERCLIEHVVLCWLRVQHVELAYTRVMAEAITVERGTYWERRLSAAQKRYLRACESLARVRRLSRQAPLRMNIGAQQMNMAGGAPSEP